MVKRSVDEERWNAGTHLFGTFLAFGGLVWMTFRFSGNWQSLAAVTCVVYASLLVLMYCMSTLSHWFEDEEKLKRFRSLSAIVANSLLIAMWTISIAGFVAKVFFSHRVNRVSVIGYVVLGWMPILGLPFHDHWPVDAMLWVLVGGIVYSLGTIFLLNDRKAKWCHPVWHLCVITASAIHFAAVAKFVVAS